MSAQPRSSQSGNLVLVGGTIYTNPTDAPVRDGAILIQDGVIVGVGDRASIEMPRNLDVLDCSGLAITAGFWNSHVHFFERKWAEAASIPASELTRQLEDMLTRYGFTSVFDTGSSWKNTEALRDRIESGAVSGPRIRSTGEALLAPGAMPSDRILGILGFMTFDAPEIGDAARATETTRKLLAQGVDGIKLHLQPPPSPNPPFPESALEPAVAEAHRSGKPVFVHPHNGADVLTAVRAGVDIVLHTTPGSGPWDETLLTTMKDADVALTPTLTLWESALRHDRISAQEQFASTAVEQLRAWLAVEGTVLFGTDLGAVDYDPTEEYRLMERAGMSFRQILMSLTMAPAEQFEEAERLGRIAPGLQADLVVLDGDPADDLDALSAVRYTLRDGNVIYRMTE